MKEIISTLHGKAIKLDKIKIIFIYEKIEIFVSFPMMSSSLEKE